MKQTKPVKIDEKIKNEVARHIVGTTYTMGGFFGQAALEKLSREQVKPSVKL